MVANYKKYDERFSFSKILWPNKTSASIKNTKKLQAVGGLTKVAIQREVGAGRNLIGTDEMSNPLYVFKDISSEDLDEERKIERFKKYISSKGFSKFEVTVWAR